MMDTGRMTRLMDMDNTLIPMVLNMKDIGLTISNTVKEKNTGQMVHSTKETISSERKMEMVISTGPTKVHTTEHL
jgi:hypothetical protein